LRLTASARRDRIAGLSGHIHATVCCRVAKHCNA
jgi:hypothetical protein